MNGHHKCCNGVLKKNPVRPSKKINCPWLVYASQRKADGLWKAVLKNSEHSHPLATNKLIYHEYRNNDPEQRAEIIEMTENMLTPAQILRQTTDKDGEQNKLPRDIYKIREEVAQTTKQSEARNLHDYLKSHGYMLRYSKTEDVIDKVFVTHKKSIERARKFPEVVVLDATYKTVTNKMPLVNIVDIDNLASNQSSNSLRSFYICSVLITNERETSYLWLLRQLKSVIFDNGTVNPGIFVTDDDKALGAALRVVYPETPHTLCAWHIRKNFDTHTSGCFTNDSDDYKKLNGAIDSMIWCRDVQGFDNALGTFKELILRTKKSKDLKRYIDG